MTTAELIEKTINDSDASEDGTPAMREGRALGLLSLFTSFGTLICCALPSLLVALGLGATVASFLSAAPWLVTLSRHKELVFAISGTLIAANFLYVYRLAPRLRGTGPACPADAPDACTTADRVSPVLLSISGVIYLVGLLRGLHSRAAAATALMQPAARVWPDSQFCMKATARA